MKPNENFDLSVSDIQTIENALIIYQSTLKNNNAKKEIVKLLAKLYHQKNWYRPKENYVGG